MTDTAGPFDGFPWAEAQWYRHAAMWAPSGVYGTPAASTTTGDLPLSVSALTVGLGAGRAHVRGAGFERTGAAVMQAVDANTHGSFSRRDRIVLRRDLATHTVTPVLLTGTPAGSPAAPALTQNDAGSWDLPMFSFLVPPNSGTAISGVQEERVWVTDTGLQVISKAVLDAYTVNQTVPARTKVQDVTTGYEWERVGSSWITPLRTVTGIKNADFTAQSFAFAALDFSSGGFTAAPVVTITPYYGRTYSTTVTLDDLTTTSATAVVRSPVNLTGPIPVYWSATGR